MPPQTTLSTEPIARYPESSGSHSSLPPQSHLEQRQSHANSWSEEPHNGVELRDFAAHKRRTRASPESRTHEDLEDLEAAHLLSSDDDEQGSSDHPMGRKSRSPNPRVNGSSETHSSAQQQHQSNGHTTGAMNSSMEMRRKHASRDNSFSTASQASNLMARESFTLDDPVNIVHQAEGSSKGFFELSKKDRSNFLLLVLLYFLQGVPMGLAGGSVPFLLKSHMSYGQIGVFSLASYPYSLKLLWSPIVDAIWSPRVGRRKSWILPIQTLSGFGMIWLGGRVQSMMDNAAKDVWGFTWWWFFLVFMCATQDIAVDGWALTLLSTENLSYASTAQTVGLTAGQFLSYTVFLAFNSPDFTNRWFRATPQPYGLMSLSGYLTFWGYFYLIVTVALAIMKREEKTKERDGIWEVYKVMGGILKLRNIQSIIIIHLIAKIGFQANDAATSLKLLDKGLSQEDLALTVLIDFPFEIALGYYVGKWSATYPPMQLWAWGFIGRLAAAGLAQATVMIFPKDGVNTWYLIVVIIQNVFGTFMGTVMFVAISAFHAKIADPVIGGTYMTLLATVSNLGGTFPRFFVLKFIDYFTVATCIPPAGLTPPEKLKGELITQPFSCALQEDKAKCLAGAGTCDIRTDGYYIVNVLCILIGIATFVSYIRPAALKLQRLPLNAWRLTPEAQSR